MSSDVIAIRASGLSKNYQLYDSPFDRLKQLLTGDRHRYGRTFHALQDVSFTLHKGEVLGLIGRNGAGKSTLLQLICGTLTPTEGQLEVNGRIAALLELGAGFNPDFSGRENVFLNASILGLSRAETEARFDEIVAFSGIGDFIDQPVKTYSSGMYVRLAFSIATSIEPDILVIDEALSVGDGEFARKSFDRIMQLRDKGATILFCSHSMYHIEAICSHALWLERGKVRMEGAPGKVTQAFNTALLVDSPAPPQAEASDGAAPAAPVAAGEARFVSITAEADGQSGTRVCLRAGESDLTVRIAFTSDPSLPTPSIAFGIENSSGLTVTSAGSLYDGTPLQRRPDGSGVAELRLPRIPLMRGEYSMSLFLGCERMMHIYDHAPHCVQIEVMQTGIEQGVVFIPREWHTPETPNESTRR
ncbi:ABC transporter ATP-binding protein [Zoogloea sp. LCSB751]|uniref:ABC transporter ATP-binding protein n=1 Tax=Zoogloea sp. LCSB751 TaxID=1965277 RepID=UPI0009A503C4|nr:ABC transporter ATP-binding protein [Zoogloea sp. LCSB751]